MPMTPEDRATKVQQAIVQLADSITEAVESIKTNGPAHPSTLAAWSRVEHAGAIVHRQSRLLAGKSKGG